MYHKFTRQKFPFFKKCSALCITLLANYFLKPPVTSSITSAIHVMASLMVVTTTTCLAAILTILFLRAYYKTMVKTNYLADLISLKIPGNHFADMRSIFMLICVV